MTRSITGADSIPDLLNNHAAQLATIETYLIDIDAGLFTDAPSTLTDIDGGAF